MKPIIDVYINSSNEVPSRLCCSEWTENCCCVMHGRFHITGPRCKNPVIEVSDYVRLKPVWLATEIS